MSENERWSTIVGAKLLSGLLMFSIFSSYVPLDFHESIRVVSLKYLMYFLVDKCTKYFWNFPILFIRSFVNPFLEIALTFFNTSSNSFLFKSVFFTKLPVSQLLAKLACLSLAVKFSDFNLLNSWVVMYLSWSWSVVILFSI